MSLGPKPVSESMIWATLLTTDAYLTGVLTLDYALKKHKSKYPLVALYTDGLDSYVLKALDQRNIARQRVECLQPKNARDFGADPRLNHAWPKLIAFALTEYEKIVLLDSDMLVMQNMDELMEIELDIDAGRLFAASHACTCNPLKLDWYPKDWIPSSCAFTRQASDPSLAQHSGLDPKQTPIGQANTGLMVIKPDIPSYERLVAVLDDHARTSTYVLADQTLIWDVFGSDCIPLPYIYNALRPMRYSHSAIWRDSEVKNVHYIQNDKPWENRLPAVAANLELHNWWWKIDDERRENEMKSNIIDGL